mmetsp:Transcript_38061/g.68573  ORF Transcript_38061/g.68573 Transcript_38061/m.68573 type:complete len:111 (-) Transcript_38061:1226-1558(-)
MWAIGKDIMTKLAEVSEMAKIPPSTFLSFLLDSATESTSMELIDFFKNTTHHSRVPKIYKHRKQHQIVALLSGLRTTSHIHSNVSLLTSPFNASSLIVSCPFAPPERLNL